MLKDVLREARNKLNLKQSEVAELMRVTTQTYLKWENGRSEPKISQVGKLAKILNVSEKELCQGTFLDNKMEPLDFVRKVGILMSHVPQTEMLIGMHQYINDPEGFISMLNHASDFPHEIIENRDNEAEKFQAKISLKIMQEQGFKPFGSQEEMERVKAHALKVLGKSNAEFRS